MLRKGISVLSHKLNDACTMSAVTAIIMVIQNVLTKLHVRFECSEWSNFLK